MLAGKDPRKQEGSTGERQRREGEATSKERGPVAVLFRFRARAPVWDALKSRDTAANRRECDERQTGEKVCGGRRLDLPSRQKVQTDKRRIPCSRGKNFSFRASLHSMVSGVHGGGIGGTLFSVRARSMLATARTAKTTAAPATHAPFPTSLLISGTLGRDATE